MPGIQPKQIPSWHVWGRGGKGRREGGEEKGKGEGRREGEGGGGKEKGEGEEGRGRGRREGGGGVGD